MKINLVIKGEPKSKQSTRISTRFGNVHGYQKKEVYKNTENIQVQVINQLPFNFKPMVNPIVIHRALFVFPPLKTFSKKKLNAIDREVIYKATKPDLHDNLFKNLMDSLEGIIFINDSQIVEVRHSMKIYGTVPRTELILEEMEKPD